jgi:hypothetical protein
VKDLVTASSSVAPHLAGAVKMQLVQLENSALDTGNSMAASHVESRLATAGSGPTSEVCSYSAHIALGSVSTRKV